MDESAFLRALDDAIFFEHLRLLPRERGDRIVVSIAGVRRTSWAGRLGFRDGDTILDVNGYSFARHTDPLETLVRLRGADALFVRFERRGRQRTHVIHIVRSRDQTGR